LEEKKATLAERGAKEQVREPRQAERILHVLFGELDVRILLAPWKEKEERREVKKDTMTR